MTVRALLEDRRLYWLRRQRDDAQARAAEARMNGQAALAAHFEALTSVLDTRIAAA